ncbi:DinB family protein [Bacillus sp. DJP31]|uniref:DinB family protein n=1 Tax=Bacillus sp. DJP31 TaxID=3409789 RepID=UPI003BB5E278
MLHRPIEGDFPTYYQGYINLVPEGDLLTILKENLTKTTLLFKSIPNSLVTYRYAPSKWSIKEVLGHISDTERIMSYRLLRIGRGDDTALSGFDENLYVEGASFDQLSMSSLLEDFTATRLATLTLVKNMPEEAWNRKGFTNNGEIISRAISYIIAGHELHHREIVRKKYLVDLGSY